MMARSCRLARQAFAKEFLQDFGYRDVRANVTVVHLALETALGEGLDVNPQAFKVLFPDDGRFGDHVSRSFQVHETSGTLEREIGLLWIDKMKHDDVVLSVAKVANGVEQGLGIVETIRDKDCHRPYANPLGESVQGIPQGRCSPGLERA
jgi:hypothetical protein